MVVAIAALLVAASGVAVGATGTGTPEPTKIVACADHQTGVLRIPDKLHCPKGTRRVAWKQNGGSVGPAGLWR